MNTDNQDNLFADDQVASPTRSPRKTARKSPKKRKSKVAKSPALANGKRRSPGQLAAMNIRKYQKENPDTRHVARAVVDRLIRELSGNEVRIADDAKTAVHDVIEDFIVTVFAEAHGEALRAGRETVQGRDINAIASLAQRGICKWF